MASYNRDTLIENLLDQTEITLKRAIEWQLIPHTTFALRPTSESWSANECLQHLNSYGRFYLPAIESVLSRSEKRESSTQFSSGWLGNYFTKLMMPGTDGKPSKKMNSPKDHSPKIIIDSRLVISEFIDQQEKLLALLNTGKKFDLNTVKVGISIAPFIKLKLGDVFRFVIAHQVRHILQAERALATAGLVQEKVIILS
ncbi:MAG: DinB family protein [Cyclobacteriaceae bacterium]|nr:DinB family protein [Cyclobacteriaceae bacterium]